MVTMTDKVLDEIDSIRNMVENAYASSKENIDRFHNLRKFLFIDTLNESVMNACAKFGWPPIQINTLEAFVSRLAGEFSKQMPSPSVRASNISVPPDIVDFVEGRLRYTFESADMDNLKKSVYMESMSGGFSAAEVIIDYESPFSFEQAITIEKCFDPTLVFFDPMARKNHKGDGDFVAKFTPMIRSSFEEKYPDFDFSDVSFSSIMPNMVGIEVPWFMKENSPLMTGNKKENQIIYLCDFYKKKMVEKTLVRIILPDGMPKDMLEEYYLKWSKEFSRVYKIAPPPVKQERKTLVPEIWLHRFVKDKYVEDPKKTIFKHLPIVNFDGNSQIIEGKSISRPYHYQAVDSQKLKNMAAIAIANGVETMNNTQFIMAEESMPTAEQDKIAFRTPQKQQAAIIYKAWPQTNAPAPNPAPIVIPKSSFDPTLLQLIQQMSVVQQETLGNFDTQLGINQGKMSGLAFQESITQSNAGSMPFINNYMDAMNQISLIYVDVLPTYHKSQRSVPVIDRDGAHKSVMINNENDEKSPMISNYDSLDLVVCVKTDVNFELQRDRALETMIELIKVLPPFAKFFSQGKGLANLMDNITIRGKESLMKNLMEFMESEKENQAANEQKMLATNPEVVKKQIADQDAKLQQMQIMVDREKMQNEIIIEKMKLQQSQLETLAKIRDTESKTQIAQITAAAEMKRADIDQAIAVDEHLSNKIENDREHLSNILDLSVKHTHNTNQHHQAMTGLALDAKAAQDTADSAQPPDQP